jgi:hypothetical protein
MGMHVGLIAVRANAHDFRAVFPDIWEKYEVVSSADELSGYDAMLRWKQANEHFVSVRNWSLENPGKEVYVFFQDGPWAVMMSESDYVLICDEEALSRLSSQFGLALSFTVESASACAFFWCFEGGVFRRSILNDGETTDAQGKPLIEEANIDIENYYMRETEELMAAFGLSNIRSSLDSAIYRAVSVIDRSDYGPRATPPRSKPSLGPRMRALSLIGLLVALCALIGIILGVRFIVTLVGVGLVGIAILALGVLIAGRFAPPRRRRPWRWRWW